MQCTARAPSTWSVLSHPSITRRTQLIRLCFQNQNPTPQNRSSSGSWNEPWARFRRTIWRLRCVPGVVGAGARIGGTSCRGGGRLTWAYIHREESIRCGASSRGCSFCSLLSVTASLQGTLPPPVIDRDSVAGPLYCCVRGSHLFVLFAYDMPGV